MDSTAGPALDDWGVLVGFLPKGWQEKARELGALQRARNIPNAEVLLRILLIHLADGCSLRETAALAKHGQLANLSDVAIMKRLMAANEWLRWLCYGVMEAWIGRTPQGIFGSNRRIVVVDGSSIKEPGPTGSSWRLHYAIDLADLRCLEAHITDRKTAESLALFSVEPNTLFMADRGYGRASDVRHVIEHGADILVRIYYRNIRLQAEDGGTFSLLRELRKLDAARAGDWNVRLIGADDWSHPVRICAIKMSERAAEEARQRVIRTGQKAGYKPSEEALVAAGYISVLTTLSAEDASPEQALQMYRGRWQVELAFKHLKSIMELGHLPKVLPASIEAWIHGKLLVAFLVEAMITAGESFFPWGYPLQALSESQPLPMA